MAALDKRVSWPLSMQGLSEHLLAMVSPIARDIARPGNHTLPSQTLWGPTDSPLSVCSLHMCNFCLMKGTSMLWSDRRATEFPRPCKLCSNNIYDSLIQTLCRSAQMQHRSVQESHRPLPAIQWVRVSQAGKGCARFWRRASLCGRQQL